MKEGGHFSVCCNNTKAKITQRTWISSVLEHDTACAMQLPFPKGALASLYIPGPAKCETSATAWLSGFSSISRPHISEVNEQQTAALCNL